MRAPETLVFTCAGSIGSIMRCSCAMRRIQLSDLILMRVGSQCRLWPPFTRWRHEAHRIKQQPADGELQHTTRHRRSSGKPQGTSLIQVAFSSVYLSNACKEIGRAHV